MKKECPSCGGRQMKKVRRDWQVGAAKDHRNIQIEMLECGVCKERILLQQPVAVAAARPARARTLLAWLGLAS